MIAITQGHSGWASSWGVDCFLSTSQLSFLPAYLAGILSGAVAAAASVSQSMVISRWVPLPRSVMPSVVSEALTVPSWPHSAVRVTSRVTGFSSLVAMIFLWALDDLGSR